MKIPVRNLYYLLCYAWGHLDEAELVDVAADPGVEPEELLGQVLVSGCLRLQRRGLDRGYRSESAVIHGIRGRIEVSATVRRALSSRAATVCTFDELTHDVLQNQIIKSIARRLQRARVSSALKHDLGALLKAFHGVSDIHVARTTFAGVQLHRNNQFYRFLLDICLLLHERLLPEGDGETFRFRSFERDEVAMRKLFQQFVFNFLDRELPEFDVSNPRIQWAGLKASPAVRQQIPSMFTDIVLDNDRQSLVIDTKYTPNAFQRRFDRETLQSAHLYQLFAYLSNIPRADRRIAGLVLYPAVGADFAIHFTVGQFRIGAASLNLGAPWREIRSQLLALVRSMADDQPPTQGSWPQEHSDH